MRFGLQLVIIVLTLVAGADALGRYELLGASLTAVGPATVSAPLAGTRVVSVAEVTALILGRRKSGAHQTNAISHSSMLAKLTFRSYHCS